MQYLDVVPLCPLWVLLRGFAIMLTYSCTQGCLSFALYLGSLWSFSLHKTRWFLFLAAAILGMGASLLWTAQGALIMALPTESQKGTLAQLSLHQALIAPRPRFYSELGYLSVWHDHRRDHRPRPYRSKQGGCHQ